MGIVERHDGAPFASGEILDGTADLEVDVSGIINDHNGNIGNENIRNAAGIDGSKLADGTLPGSKLQSITVTASKIANDTITKVQMDAETLPQADLVSEDLTGDMTDSSTFVEMFSSSLTVNPTAVTDILFMDVCFTANSQAVTLHRYEFLFEVDAVQQPRIGIVDFRDASFEINPMTFNFAMVTPSVGSPIVIRMLLKHSSGGSADRPIFFTGVQDILRAQLIPQK